MFTVFFCFESMHFFLLGVGKMIKESVVHMLCHGIRTTPAIRTTNNMKKPFRSIKSTVTRVMNQFFRDTKLQSQGYGLKHDYSQNDYRSLMCRLYYETGIQEMLETADFESIDSVIPFLGALVNAICRNAKSAEVTEISRRFGNIVNFVFRKSHETCWNDELLALLWSKTANFKSIPRTTISNYQPFSLVTQKWYVRHYFSEAMNQIGCTELVHVGTDEASHKLFKQMYGKSSRRKRTTMDEVVAIENAPENNSVIFESTSKEQFW